MFEYIINFCFILIVLLANSLEKYRKMRVKIKFTPMRKLPDEFMKQVPTN